MMRTPLTRSCTRSTSTNRWGRILAAVSALGLFAVAGAARADGPPGYTPYAGVFGGSTDGVGADAATGTARASYPIAIPPARGTQQPIINLGYAHTSPAISEVGAGWSLGLPSIERRAVAGGPPTFTSTDAYFLSGARLTLICVVSGTTCNSAGAVPMPHWSSGWKVYRPEVDSSYTRAFLKPDGLTWRLQTKSGEILELGKPLFMAGASYESQDGYDSEGGGLNISRWKLVRQFGAFSAATSPQNIILYSWRHWRSGDVSTLLDIYYTPPVQAPPDSLDAYAHHIHFRYQRSPWRPRQFADAPPWLSAPDWLVDSIEIASKGQNVSREQVRRYWLTYSTIAGRPYLARVVMEGRCPASPVAESSASDGFRNILMLPASSVCLKAEPGTAYTYTQGGSLDEVGGYVGAREPQKIHFSGSAPFLSLKNLAMVDVNRDGLADFVQSDPPLVYLNRGRAGEPGGRDFATGALNLIYGFGKFSKSGLSILGGWDDTWGPTWLHRNPFDSPTQVNGGPREIYQLKATPGSSTDFEMWLYSTVPPVMPPPHVYGDLDGDGSTDVIYLDETVSPATTFARMSLRQINVPGAGGQISPLTTVTTTNLRLRIGSQAPRFAALADFNGDGIADYVTDRNPGQDATLVVIPGRGKGQFGGVYCPTCVLAIGSPGYNQSAPASSLAELPIDGGGDLGLDVAANYPMYAQDLTGDGKADIIQFYRHPDLGWTADVWINAGGLGTMKRDRISFPDGDYNLTGEQEPGGPPYAPTVFFGDVDGDGLRDLVICGDNECVYRSYSPFHPAGLLTRIDHESGATTEIDYHATLAEMELEQQSDPSANPWPADGAWTRHAPIAVWPVKTLRTSNNAPAPYAVTKQTYYQYRDPAFDRWAGTLRGFRRVRATSGNHAIETKYQFEGCLKEDGPASADSGSCLAPEIEGGLLAKAMNGQPIEVAHLNPATGVYHSTIVNHYGARTDGDQGVGFVYIDQVDTYLYDTANYSSSPSSVTLYTPLQTSYTVDIQADAVQLRRRQLRDASGNLAYAWDDGRVDSSGGAIDRPIRTIFTWQSTDAATPTAVSALGREYLLTSTETCFAGTTIDACGKGGSGALLSSASGLDGPLRKILNTYDSLGRLTRSRSTLLGSLPLLREHAAGAAKAPEPPQASIEGSTVDLLKVFYDAYGNVNQRQGSTTGECQTVDYDAQFKDYPTTTHTWLGASCTGTDLSTSLQFDRGLSLPIKRTETTGAESGVDFDAFGRPTLTWTTPSGGARSDTMQYAYSPLGQDIHWVHATRLAANPTDGTSAWSFTDTMGGLLATLTQADPTAGDGGDWVVHPAPARDSVTGAPIEWYRPWFGVGVGSDFAPGAPLGGSSGGAVYDFMGRTLERYRSSDAQLVERRAYHQLSTDVWDGENLHGAASHLDKYTTTTLDGHGRPHEVRKFTEGGNLTTLTDYLATGELAVVEREETGTQRYRRWLRYDSLGRIVENAEPNTATSYEDMPLPGGLMKAWRYAYDNSGRTVGTRDARGCGKNVFYDLAGRPVAEDYSPCLASQDPYSAYDAATGDRSEAFYRYDTAEPGEPSEDYGGNIWALRGKLVSVRDRGAHTRLAYDGKGRVVGTQRRIAKPGTPSDALGSRYSSHWFRTTTTFDAVDRVDWTTTGADVDELMPAGSSALNYHYTARGAVASIDGSYGPLLLSQSFTVDGAPQSSLFGDAKSTQAAFTYDENRRLQEYTLVRGTGDAPAALIAHHFYYDGVGNVTGIYDFRDPTQWPDGAKPISRTMAYDAMYHLTAVNYEHQGDSLVSPFAAEELASDARPLPRIVPPTNTRVISQTFAYDALGNVTDAYDDAVTAFDRGFGTATMGSMGAPTESARKPNQLLYTEVPSTPGGVEAHYDAAGNLTDLTLQRTETCAGPTGKCSHRFLYDWDEVGQLAHARRWDYASLVGVDLYPAVPLEQASIDLRYAYSEGSRVIKQAVDPAGSSADDRFTIDVFGSLRLNHASYSAGEYERTASTETVYLAGLGRALFAPGLPNTGSDLHVFLQFGDHLGSASVIIDKDTGELVEQTTYLAYGATESDYRPAEWQSFREDFKFTGKEEDIEVGLTYFGARYYSPYLARFISPDPLTVHGLGGDLNPYAYVAGHAFNSTDPDGLCEHGREGCQYGGANGGDGGGGDGGGGGASGGGTKECQVGDNGCFGGGGGGGGGGGASSTPPPPPRPPGPSPQSLASGIQNMPAPGGGRLGGYWQDMLRLGGTEADFWAGAQNQVVGTGAGLAGPVVEYLATDFANSLKVPLRPTLLNGLGQLAAGYVLIVAGQGAGEGLAVLGEMGTVAAQGPAAFGSGKGPHTALVTVFRDGQVVAADTLVSGSMTAEEAALGFPRSSLATHTEVRAVQIPLQPGDTMIIEGQFPPCPSCKGAMNKAATSSGAEIYYLWENFMWAAGKR